MDSRRYRETDGISSNTTPCKNPFLTSSKLKHLKKTKKQAFDSKVIECINAFLLSTLPVAIQNYLGVSLKQDPTLIQNGDFIQRRYQYQLFMGTQQPQPFNEVSSRHEERQNERATRQNPDQQKMFSGTSFQCNKKSHKALDCRTRKRELEQNELPHTESSEQRPQQEQNKMGRARLNYNPKLVCQICGNTGHSELTSTHKNTNTNTYRSIAYQGQNPDGNRSFRKDFKQANK